MPVYFISYSLLFWLPSIIFVLLFFKLSDRNLKKSFWLTTFIMAVVSVIMEYLYIKFDVWWFSQDIDPLLGIWIWKVPIEEYVFWFGATPFCLSLYLMYSKFLGKKKDGDNAGRD